MKERIEELVKEGFTAAGAAAIVEAETKREEALIKEGFAKEKAGERARREVRFEFLVKEKRMAGLSVEQAQAVATEQLANDARVAALEAKAAKAAKKD
jgi:hypothetical protein